MARKRMVDPAMFTSESVAALSHRCRWTWVGLLTYLDDQGRGKDLPALIKASVWPLDDTVSAADVAADVDALVAIGSLCRYQCCDRRQLHAPTWETWQKISHPTPTKLCPCPEHSPGFHEQHTKEVGAAREGLPNLSGKTLHRVVQSSSEKISSSDPVGAAALRAAPAGAFSEVRAQLAAKRAASQ